MRERATIRISPEGCQILRAVNPVAAQLVAATQRPSEPSGWVVAEIPVESPTYSARQLLRLGAEMEVLAPAALRAAVTSEASAVLTIHAGRPNT
jgi:predicted DNA-binding transcriptional regulator YafY